MSLPNYLAKIKSAGIYRFVWDKSVAPIQAADTLRLVVGYSEKGPFNTPVYIDNTADFKTIFGGISKRLEKKGVYFHRMALQALAGGPILALNLKKFSDETVSFVNFDADSNNTNIAPSTESVLNIFDTNRFWTLDPKVLSGLDGASKYITIAATDSKETSCTIFVRKYTPSGYDVTAKTWYSSRGEEFPSYLEGHEDMLLEDTFAEIYVFRGKFTKEIASTPELSKYFDVDGETVALKSHMTNAFGEEVDVLAALADDECSNFVNVYRGTLLPDFKDNSNAYISLDIVFNLDNNKHKMLMNLNSDLLEDADDVLKHVKPVSEYTDLVKDDACKFVSYASDKTTKFATGVVSCVVKDGKTEVTIVENNFEKGIEPNDEFAVGKVFNIKSTKIGEDMYEVFSGDKSTGIYVKIELSPAAKLTGSNWVSFETTPIYLEGYTYSTIEKNDKGFAMQSKILSVLTDYKGIIEALTNNVDVEYHYIVDTFESFIGTGAGLKTELALIAKKKDNCLAILNFPFMSEMTKDSRFIDSNTKTFDVKQVKKYITLPATSDGASWCAFYTAITLSDGTVKTYCPSAAAVSNLFMDKYGARQPYSIVAGPNYGLVTADGMVGPDYNFSRNELDFMEPFGVNCLVYVPRRGTQINSNQTAKQTPVSALSKVHVRELVIYLQDEIAAMLQSYQWEFNTQTLRDTVKAKADKLLENVQQNGGVYAFKNICDESNNTDDVINNEMLILSTHIEPGMGAGKLVEELTIYRKGGMSSSAV